MVEHHADALAPLFQAVGEALHQNQLALNQADSYNGNHGDHMVEIFTIAANAAEEMSSSSLPEAMEHAAALLLQLPENGSAQVYAHGLEQIAEQFRSRQLELDDLLTHVRKALSDKEQPETHGESNATKSGEVLKALMASLVNWGRIERGQPISDRPLDMGTLFEFGMAYLQARQHGGERAEVLADAATSVSPLSSVPHRYQSGKLAILALLQAIQRFGRDLPAR